jgi:hypothetical protein
MSSIENIADEGEHEFFTKEEGGTGSGVARTLGQGVQTFVM